ncbi:MAG: peptidylprolyl isomerase [Bacteroidales bacterium]|nr:peptidylprolyl isomerase [Bacteroidales bacterium]
MSKVKIITDLGDIVVKLYDETPLHRDNFIKLAKEGFYDGTLFHRVIKDFMIQGGDPESKGATKGKQLGSGDAGYTLPAEFKTGLFHKRGALAAARQGDNVNPERRSSGCQFYIVWGQTYKEGQLGQLEKQMKMQAMQSVFNQLCSDRRDLIMAMRRNRDNAALQKLQDELNELTQQIVKDQNLGQLSAEQKEAYTTLGGTPFLDDQYTVFGEVEQGLEIVAKIQEVTTDRSDRPLKDISMKMEVID